MYGKLVKITYKGNNYKLYINCLQSTPMKELQKRAELILAAVEKDRPDLSLDEIVIGLNSGAI